jgi:decaprenylphospho-beta-D-ribofuranose 2-oxidase
MTPRLPSERKIAGLSGWGRFPVADCVAVRPERMRDLRPTGETCIARGLGRSYGDAALDSRGRVVLTERLDRFVAFDPETGVLRAEAGATLDEVLTTFVPRGWFVPVTPGTKFCTLGGCLAADVHGKNHHRDGTFSRHVNWADVVLASGERVRCSPETWPELFWATAGGMGLTGLIAEMELRLTPIETAWMDVRHTRCRNLEDTVRLLSDPTHDARYTVAWLDCLATGDRLGRGILMAGEHAPEPAVPLRKEGPLGPHGSRQKPFPFDLPGWALNPVTVRAFNRVYDWLQGRRGRFLSHYDRFFYPLDGIQSWNRMYGKRGFVQYQFVLPTESALDGMRLVLGRLSRSGRASFLAVLKRFGPEGPGLLSFPTEGLTLALDIPMSDGLLPFLDELDRVVADHGGRTYLAKDSRTRPDAFVAGYPRLGEFRQVKAQVDSEGQFASDLWRRLGGAP